VENTVDEETLSSLQFVRKSSSLESSSSLKVPVQPSSTNDAASSIFVFLLTSF
jgi:hypothetical protein